MSHVKPSNEQNAIKVVAFALEFIEEIEEALIHEVITLYQSNNKLKETLPRKELHQSVTIQLGSPQQATPKPVGGITFDYLSPDGTQKWALSLTTNALIISCAEYTRWEKIWLQAKEYFSLILPLLSKKHFSLVALEYIDEFIIESDSPPNEWKKKLFKEDSKYIPANIYETKNLWHSHHGFISNEVDDDVNTIHNINIDHIQEQNLENKIIIRTLHKSQFLQPKLYDADFLNKIVEKIFNKSHDENKEIMGDLLSAEMCSEINLKTGV